MPFTIENEQTMLSKLLEIVEKQLNIEFYPSERKVLFEYMKNNPSADPKKIMGEILALAEKKPNKIVTEEHKKEIEKSCRDARIPERMAKTNVSWTKKIDQAPKQEPLQKLTDKEIKRIIDEAEKKLLDKKILPRQLDDKGRGEAEKYLRENTKENDSSLDIANRAILGVAKVGIAGGIQVVVLQNFGNPLIPVLGSFGNNTDSNTIVNQSNALNFSLSQDSMGAKCHEVLNLIKFGGVVVKAEELSAGGSTKSSAPVPTPYGRNL